MDSCKTWMLGVFVVVALATTGCSSDSDPPASIPSEPVTGTLSLKGCALGPADVKLRAVPLAFSKPDSPETSTTQTRESYATLAGAAGSPDRFDFTVGDLQAGQVYKLEVAIPAEACGGRVFWTAPGDGLVVGGQRDVAVAGHVARTTIAILQNDTVDSWVGADDLQFTDPAAAVRSIRWKSTLKDVVGGELQVSTEPFPTPTSGATDSCSEPAKGIVHRQGVTVRGNEWTDVGTLDFRAIVSPSRSPDPDGAVATVDPGTYRQLTIGAPLYVRVIPQTIDGPACDPATAGVHGWVVLSRVPQDLPVPDASTQPAQLAPSTGQAYLPAYYAGGVNKGHPGYRELAFKVIEPHPLPAKVCKDVFPLADRFVAYMVDPLGCMWVDNGWAAPGTAAPVGTWFYFRPPASGAGSDVFSGLVSAMGSLVTETSGAVGDAVDYASRLWQSVKKAVAGVMTELIGAIPILSSACDGVSGAVGSSCAKFVEYGLDTGLAAMGIPPSLPNWEQLKDQGIDYLAAEIASQMSPVPAELTELALKQVAQQAIDRMDKKRAQTAGSPYTWVIPYSGFDPAVFTITVGKTGTLALADNIRIVRPANPLYLGGQVGVPTKFPASGELKIPMVLPASRAGIPQPLCRTDRFKLVTCEPSLAQKPTCLYEVSSGPGGLDWAWASMDWSVDCATTHEVQVYFRDQWVKKAEATPCVVLGAVSYQFPYGVLPSLYPEPPYVNLAEVRSLLPASWDGGLYKGCN